MRTCSTSFLVLGFLVSGVLYYNTSTGLMHLPMWAILLPFILSVLLTLALNIFSSIIDVIGRIIRRFTHWIY